MHVTIIALWIPILVSAVAVFFASYILHMVLPIHRKDYKPVPGEDAVREAIRNASVPPGDYAIPCPSTPKEMASPEMMEKYKQGPVCMLTVWPSGPPAMGKSLGLWFVFCLLVSVVVAYLTGRTNGEGAEYLAVFRVAGTTAFLAHSAAHATASIWKGQQWSTTFKHMLDGLIYALIIAGIFGAFWPDAAAAVDLP